MTPGLHVMELNPPDPLLAIDAGLLLRLAAATLIGVILGLDRELRGHAAGLRTHGLVCLAAAATTISIIDLYFDLDGPRMDPLRIFEATGAFIGIIGAGLIVFSRGKVHNLTTAAHLWVTAALGIACGAGQWPLVAVGTALALILLIVLRFVEDKGNQRRLSKGKDKGEE